MLSQPALPSWAALAALVPSSTVKRPISTDWILTPDHDSLQSSGRLTLFRERNGWCPYSARLWLALELKELDYDTVRIDTSFNGRPSFLSDATPQIQWPDGAVQDGSVDILFALDARYPHAPLCSVPGVSRETIEQLIAAYHETFGGGSVVDGEPMRIEASRVTLEAAADRTEALLAEIEGGPFFCGSSISVVDVVWAPFLERYASWVPFLHPNLELRRNPRWPRIAQWFDAMEECAPAYACRLRGDPTSWWKVLAFSPGWLIPPSRGWTPPPLEFGRNGEKSSAQARSDVSAAQWTAYASSRAHVASDASAECAAHLIRNRQSVADDAQAALRFPSAEQIDIPLRALTWLLSGSMLQSDALAVKRTAGLQELIEFLDQRVCVPRDMGAPEAAALTRLRIDLAETQL